MRNKKVIFITLGIVLFSLIGHSVFIKWNKSNVTVSENTAVAQNQDGKELEETIIQIDDIRDMPIEEEFPDGLAEENVQQAIHDMSHQKVLADQKWGFLPLTQERVLRLIEVVELNQNNYIHADVYLSILKRWEKNDFSQVDSDHNAIWNLQNGTIGKAYGIMSVEEEREYIKKHFNIVEKK
ncbi:DUF6241 domain-containing protein [Sporosarcina pasteurii]|uniref:Uncharacterized protein n=1 Tax=Sporosarcina pasteurii TaxID=1474 RepID=A0A380C289_SPOPA|nr:DUF6241 domain-containing protein [Sporosarcina pasteurii]MDS9471613.1 DUF6241 domain-containing protein [Sporosarcina pasteurii]QBQ04777.1 hypothetical protein E2C16_03405 [Sporosarcina pasteurii]SUJ11356.1 Uncharacterised protein [Sporosarcina pasteurii]